MKIKTLILTFFMMMSSPFLFGQHWVDPTLPGEDVMTVTAKVTLDGELQSGESYEVAVFNGDKLVEVGTFTNHGIPELEYHVGLTIPGGEGDKFYFKFFNGTNEYVSLTEIDYADEQGSHLNLFTIEFKSVAQIGNVVYPSLQDAIDAAANEDVITLLQANAENVTVVQAPGVAFTIDGAEKTMTGTITVNGKSAAYPTAGLTIKNVNFDATNIAKDASIVLGVKNDNNTRYTNGVTVENCNFTGDWDTTGEEKSAIKNYTGGCKNLTVTGGTFTGLHSLMQVKGVNGITISGVTVENCKNGIAVGTSTNVAISGSTISATGYGVRADGDGAYTMTLTNNTISAELPVVVRNAKEVAYNLTIEGDNNNYTASNENGYQVVFTTGDDGTYVAPTTGQFVLTVPENFNVYPVYVAQVGDNKYTSIVKAINEAADGATVQLLPGTIDEYVYPWPESNHSKEKSITIVGAENYGTTLTAGMFLGYDDSQCREHNITVNGINFTGKGLTVACQQNVTIEDNKFNNITEGRAIAVIGKNINSVVKNNVIDNVTTSQVGIELRNTLTATVEGNIISNTGHNSLQITSQVDATNSTITVKNNTMSNWGLADNANGEKEGRAMRINNIITATISGNVMSHTAAPEEFVKVTGSTTLDASANYWNGISPLTDGMFAGVEGDLVPVLKSYYTDAEKKNLVTLAPSVAMIGDVYYQSLQKAIDAATEGQTITLIDDIEVESSDVKNEEKETIGYFNVNEDDKIVIDLNGKNITVTESATGNFYLFYNFGELTLNDSKESAVVELTATNNRANAQSTIVLNRGGVLNINGGKYVHKGGTDMAITICNSANSFGPAYLYVNGGEIISETYVGVRMRMENPDENGTPGNDISYMYVTDGYIYGSSRGIWGQKSSGANEKQGELVVTGGIIENATADHGAIQFDTDTYEAQNVVATISGDAFIKGQVIAGKDEMSITGGTFTTDVTEYCAFGYTCQDNGDGTYGIVETTSFEIPNLDRLVAFRNAVNAGNNFKGQTVTVTDDISMGDVENWTPIGTMDTPFMGTFDGGNFTISNLKAEGEKYVGLFGYANKATIKNVKIENANVYGVESVGALAGSVYSESTIENCHVSGLIQVEGLTKVGGIHGYGYAKIINSSVVGSGDSYIKGTYVQADQEGDNVGGIVGHGGEGNTIEACTVKDIKVIGTRKVGGIVGTTDRAKVLDNCLVDGVVIENTAEATYAENNAATTTIGGLIGNYHGNGKGGSVINCVVKNVTFTVGNAKNVGPIVGGYRNAPNEEPTDVTASGNLIYMSTISDNTTNTYLMHAVAQIGETEYYTLQDAVTAAANAETTITYIASTKEEIAIQEGANITLDFAENVTLDGNIIAPNANLTINNGIISNTNSAKSGIQVNAGTLNLNGVNITSARHALRLEGTNGEVVATINGGTYKLHEVTSQTQHVLNAGGDGEQVTVTILGGTFVGPRGTNSDSGAAINAQTNAIVTIEGGDFSGGKNNTLSKKEAATITVTGGTYDQDPTAYVAQGYVVKYNETTSRYEVFLGVAKIVETDVIYGTLAQAIGAATAGNTITLLANVTEDVTVNKNLTIDGKAEDATTNSTYTGKMTVNSSLNINIRNIDFDKGYIDELGGEHGYFTIVNCNFDGKDNSIAYAVTVRGGDKLTIENSTAKNYSYGMLYIPSAVANIAIKDVEVSNVTAAFNISYSGDGTFENVEVDNVTYGLHVQNYGSRTFTLKDCVMNNVNYPTYIQQKSTAEVTFEFNNVLGYKETINSGSNQAKYGKYVLTSTAAKLTNVPDDFNVTVSKDLADNGYVVEYNEGVYSVVAGNVLNSTTGKKYATIQDAIDAAQNGDVVVVLKDLTVTKDDAVKLGSYNTFFKVENKTVTIDLNGCNITGDVTGLGIAGKVGLVGLFSTNGEGHLTLEDSKGGAEVKIDNATETDPVYYLISSFDGAKGSITINGGSYSLNAAQDALIHSAGDECITINGGNFYLGNIGTSGKGNGHPWIVNVNGSNAGNITINGGTFNDDMNHQAWDMEVYVPETLALQNNGDGTWTVVESVAYVEEKGTLTGSAYHKVGYATLAEAFEATTIRNAKDNTVTVVKDIELEESITVNAEQEVVLDLNGKVVSYESAIVGEDMITNKGKLTIESNVEGGKLTYNNSNETGTNVTISTISTEPGSELIINSGIIENTSLANNTSNVLVPYTIDILTNGNLGDVAVTINGGSIISENYIAIRQFVNGNVCNNSLIVKDGTIQALKRAINVQDAQGTGEVKNCAKLLVEGGNITATDENGYSICNLANSENISVTGGNFVGQVYSAIDGIITGGTFNMEPYFAYCAEGFAAVDNGNGTWTVMPTQEQSLLNGWNWYSTYLDITLNDLTTTLGDNGISIKNFNGITKENNGGFWMGTLNEINPSEMYMIQTTTECDLKLAADLLNPNEHQISLSANWNWIGYPSNQEVAINVALANIPEPKEGDIIKSLNNGYAEYAFGLWIGTLNTMVPGVGYKYNNKSGEAKTFYYNIEATRGAVEANVTAENNYWTPNATKYPHNMTMTAVVDGLTNGNYEVAAFVNGEVRGSARPVYVEALDAYIFFLTIHGEDVEEMSFRLYDIDTDTEYDLNDRINYSNDAHLGSISEPYVFSRGTTGIGEAALSEINIYPNPTTTGSTINLQATCDTVEVFNALGVKVAEYHNVDSIDALETAGIYVIRITNDGNTQNCRLVVK